MNQATLRVVGAIILMAAVATSFSGCSNSELVDAQARVEELETQVQDLQERIDTLESGIRDIRGSYDDLTSAIADLDSAASKFRWQEWEYVVGDVQNAISDVQNAVADLDGAISEVE